MKMLLLRAKSPLIFLVLASGLYGQEFNTPRPVREGLVNRLPAAYQEEVRKSVTIPNDEQEFCADLADTEWTGIAFNYLVDRPEGASFLKARLESEPSGVIRAQLFVALEQYFARHPKEQLVLEKHIASDPDPTATLAALETLRRIRQAGVGELLEKRIKTAEKSNRGMLKPLRDEYLSLYMWYGDTRLPAFAYSPPPAFQAKPAGQPIRVLAFGDFAWGTGDAQSKVATAMLAYHQEHPFDFGITLGDNFYGRGPFFFAERTGLSSPLDPRWQTQWEQLYGPMGIKFYPSFGNADYIDKDGPAAELAYTKMSQTWFFPAPYYTYTAGSLQFFSIDNIRLSDDELHWLDEELAKSKARWKVVYGHYPIYSGTEGDNEELIARLFPILKKNSVDIYLDGHLHEMQEVEPQGSVHFFVSGGGGAALSGPARKPKTSELFRETQHGFSVLEADERRVDVIFINDRGEELRRSRITK